jgi:diamine N-acetyltransferase
MKEPNIRLRALELEDLDFLYHIENDDRLWELGVSNVPS